MTLKDKLNLIGQEMIWQAESGLKFRIVIKDVKQSYGNIRVLVSPVAGSGQAWINMASVLDIGEEN